jgi:hypothetical protein
MHCDEISDHLLRKDSDQFWWSWNAKRDKTGDVPYSVAGCSDPSDIASAFMDFYSKVYVTSAEDRDAVGEFVSLSSVAPVVYNSLPNIDVETIENDYKTPQTH